MATTYYIGTDGDWSAAGNWTAGVPATGDTAILDRAGNASNIVAGLNQSAVDLALLFIDPSFTMNIGTTAEPLQISAARAEHHGAGTLHIKNVTGSAAQTDLIIVNYTGPSDRMAARIQGGWVDKLAVSRGRIEVPDIGVLRDLVTNGRNNEIDVDVTASTTILRVKMNGGRIWLHGAADGGEFWVADGTLINESTALSLATLQQMGGVVEWNSSVPILEAAVYEGLLDFTRSGNTKTITQFFLFPRGQFSYYPALTSVTPEDLDGTEVVTG